MASGWLHDDMLLIKFDIIYPKRILKWFRTSQCCLQLVSIYLVYLPSYYTVTKYMTVIC